MTTATVQANGITLAYDDQGPRDAPVILLVMGLGAQLTFWPDDMVAALVEHGFRVVRFDNRDIGLSTQLDHVPPPSPVKVILKSLFGLNPGVPYRLPDMARDAVGLMDALAIGKAHIVGASMGGMIAQLMAAHHPDRVLTLTSIMSTSGARGLPGPSGELRKALMRPRKVIGSRDELIAEGIAMYELIGTPDDGTRDAARRDLITRAFDRAFTPNGARRQLAAILASGSRAADLPRITAPTLVIHGAIDRLVPPECGADTARRIPGARFELIGNMAHDLPPHALPTIIKLITDHASPSQ